MATIGGTNIVKDGLIFWYDADDRSSRFYKGEPTINLADTDAKRTLYVHSGTATFSEAPEKGIGWKKATITSHSTNFRLLRCQGITVPDNLNYTFSIEYDFGNTTGYFWAIDGSGGYSVYASGDDGEKWQKTIYNSSGKTAEIFLYHNTLNVSGLTDTIYYRYHQIEQKDHATQFTSGTRLNNSSLIDLKKNSVIDLSNVSFDNNARPYFDGIDDYVSINDSFINYGNGFSMSAWIKANSYGEGPYGRIFDKTNDLSSTSGIYTYMNNSPLITLAVNNTAGITSTASSIPLSTWKYVNFNVFYNGKCEIYIDGEFNVSGSTAIPTGITTTNPLTIGNRSNATDRTFNGYIDVVKIYNRPLMPDEVKQNYNATKYRFVT